MKNNLPSATLVVADKDADTSADTAFKLVEKGDGLGDDKTCYFIDDAGYLFKAGDYENALIANFYLTIQSQDVRVDEGKTNGRVFHLQFHQDGLEIPFDIDESGFVSNKLRLKILEIGGHKAILYGSAKDLALAAQELSEAIIPEAVLSTSNGFDADGNYFTRGIVITPKEIARQDEYQFDLSESRFAKNLSFGYFTPDELNRTALNIKEHFLQLKSLSVMFPTMGHICLAPFVSQITRSTGRKKPALHLQGPSGCGKSFIGTLAMSFFGNFDDQVQSWESTKNAIEKEGFYFRDALYVVDDFKLGCIDPKVLIEVIQHYADGHGRSRLKPDTKMGNLYSIRGLLTSTGENFVSGVESVSARTIVIKVEPEINRKNGTLCWQSRGTYKAFLPYLIYNVISDHKWKDTFCSFVNDYTDVLVENVNCLSNGLRISSNWALNAWGFRQFTKTLVKLGVIDNTTENSMLNHYDEIAAANIRDHATRIVQENPVNVFFETIGQAIAAGEAQLHGMKGVMKSVQPIGKVKLKEGLVYIVPDAAIEVVIERFKTIGQKYPFTKNSLRDALAGQGMISKVKDGRWTVQVRFPDGTRHQAWEINLDEFKKWSGI